MNKNLKHVNGVFTEIVGTNKQLSEFERFLNDGPIKMSPVLTKMTGTYKNIVTKWKAQFDTVSLLEETILQLRAKENIKEIKLSIVRGDYIYARSPFFRKGSSTKDVRVIVGNTKNQGNDLNRLEKDIQFMESAKRSIQVAMDKQIAENRNELTKLLNM
tara:strand:+ start:5534 stop:6010 length:477 start_codon:yes stop_codon:yes gene_type:complete